MGKLNTFEGGTDGATITVANSGGASGDAFAIEPQPTSGNQWTYEADAAHRGTLGARRVLDATGGYLRLDVAAPGGRTGAGGWFYLPAVPSSSAAGVVIQARSAADATIYNCVFRSTGSFAHAPGGTINTSAANQSPAITVPAWYHVECWLYVDTANAANDTAQIVIRDESWAVVWDHTLTGASGMGTVDPARFRLGGVTNAGGWSVMDLDDLRVDQLTAPAVFDQLLTAPTLVLTRVGNVIDARGSTYTGTPTFAITDADSLTYEQVTPGVFVFDDDGTGHTVGVSLTDDVDTATGTIDLPAVTATRRVGELVRIGDRWQ
ncbi:hypothetical protein OEB99_16445 [Actinotalea sp. M2MS4P-6]|uniref:hypothetical protein n=1 Tax=Actinotalea sp. M2MS4P-6 TaxID=2983762 RepID=UPI0021E3B03D|nr:hypothetical protein [Actinotalea sp. M2MS4P-6]MCV2395906.1 hypothetical protein [Actinotalea sp. M2MS4P-6]